MKKITFILFALVAGTAFGQNAATANAAADIVSPISIDPDQDLNFGKVSNNIAGTVVVATDGTATGLPQIGATTPAAATFKVTAAENFRYTITLPGTVELKSGENIIEVTDFNHNGGAEPIGSGKPQTLGVGATLNVAAGQATGNYTGTFDVSVAYE